MAPARFDLPQVRRQLRHRPCGFLHPFGRFLPEPRHGPQLRRRADGRRAFQTAMVRQKRAAHRQHAGVLAARPGRLSLRLHRSGNRARRADRHPPRRNPLQRPRRLPPHDPQRRAHPPLRGRPLLPLVDYRLPLFRRRHDARPGFPAPLLLHAPAGPHRAHVFARARCPLARRRALPLARRAVRLLPPRWTPPCFSSATASRS